MCVCVCVCVWSEPPPTGGSQTRRECTCVPACGPSGLKGHLGSRGDKEGVGSGGVTMHRCRGRGVRRVSRVCVLLPILVYVLQSGYGKYIYIYTTCPQRSDPKGVVRSSRDVGCVVRTYIYKS